MFAEENALEDTIYYLSEGLRKDAIDLESFLKVMKLYKPVKKGAIFYNFCGQVETEYKIFINDNFRFLYRHVSLASYP